MKRITVTLSETEHKKLKRIAGFHKRSLDSEGGVAIAAYIAIVNPEPVKK